MLFAGLLLRVYIGSAGCHEVNLNTRPGNRTVMVEIQVFSKSSPISVAPEKRLSQGKISSAPAIIEHNVL
jgi:hypothetical protein